MKTISAIAIGLFTAASVFAADTDSKAAVKAAAKKLADKGNYSWTSTPKFDAGAGGGGGGNFRPGATEGKADGGLVHLKMSFGDRSSEALIKGGKAAVSGEDGWQSADELEGNRAFMARRFQTYKAPAQEAQDLADKAKALKEEAGVISGDLTEDGAKDLLSFGRRPNADSARPGPKNAKGKVQFWVKDGTLTKYEYTVQGTVVGREDQERNVTRTTTIEIKDVGTTKLNVPDEAKKKVS